MATNNVSYASSHQTTFARYCANMVVNTSRPFSLQEKHVRLWKTPSSSDQHHFFSGGISVFQFWHVLRPRTCTRTSHGCSMHRYRKWGAVVWPGEQYSSRESNNADFSKWNYCSAQKDNVPSHVFPLNLPQLFYASISRMGCILRVVGAILVVRNKWYRNK